MAGSKTTVKHVGSKKSKPSKPKADDILENDFPKIIEEINFLSKMSKSVPDKTSTKVPKKLAGSKVSSKIPKKLSGSKVSKSFGSKVSKSSGSKVSKKFIKEEDDVSSDESFAIKSSSKTSVKKKSIKKKSKAIMDYLDIEDSVSNVNQDDEVTEEKENNPVVPQMKTILEKSDMSAPKINHKKITNPIVLEDKKSIEALNAYKKAISFLVKNKISVSTITLDCKLHTKIDADAFAKYVVLREDEVVSVKFGNRKDPATNRTIIMIKTKKKPSSRNFFNQVTVLMKPQNNLSRNYINIKVFKNGSLQMTGCKDMEDFFCVTQTLIEVLKRGKDITTKNGKTKHIDYVEEPDKIGIFDAKIRMINSNFKLPFKVDREKLFKLLKKNHKVGTKDEELGYIECKYEPTGGHSCVNIKYRYDEKNKPSIFIFQTGAVIITGAKNYQQIIAAYEFNQKILARYMKQVEIVELDKNAIQAEMIKYFKNKELTMEV
jgi:TATA-box binding protein (TBP) (component of TFIID and TFIIIB)